MNFLLNTANEITKQDYNSQIIFDFGPGATFIFGLKIFLIGMGAVFASLCLIWFALYIFKVVFHDLSAKRTALPVVEKVSEPVIPVAPVISNDDEIIAVIAAAIAAAECEAPNSKFRVVSFRRT